jgi:hypothetical protein
MARVGCRRYDTYFDSTAPRGGVETAPGLMANGKRLGEWRHSMVGDDLRRRAVLAKPTPSFPRAHGRGQWAKKVRGKIRYFGPWNDPAEAFRRCQAVCQTFADDGKSSRPKGVREHSHAIRARRDASRRPASRAKTSLKGAARLARTPEWKPTG